MQCQEFRIVPCFCQCQQTSVVQWQWLKKDIDTSADTMVVPKDEDCAPNILCCCMGLTMCSSFCFGAIDGVVDSINVGQTMVSPHCGCHQTAVGAHHSEQTAQCPNQNLDIVCCPLSQSAVSVNNACCAILPKPLTHNLTFELASVFVQHSFAVGTHFVSPNSHQFVAADGFGDHAPVLDKHSIMFHDATTHIDPLFLPHDDHVQKSFQFTVNASWGLLDPLQSHMSLTICFCLLRVGQASRSTSKEECTICWSHSWLPFPRVCHTIVTVARAWILWWLANNCTHQRSNCIMWWLALLHFPLKFLPGGGVHKEEEIPMSWEFIFFIILFLVFLFFRKAPKGTPIRQKMKEKERSAKLLLFHAD